MELNLGSDAVQDEVESTLKPLIVGNFRGHLDKSLHVRIISGSENCFREVRVVDRRPSSFALARGRPRTFGGDKAIHKYEQDPDNPNGSLHVQKIAILQIANRG